MAVGLLGLKVGHDAGLRRQGQAGSGDGPAGRALPGAAGPRPGARRLRRVQLGFLDKPRRKATRPERGHVSAELESKRRRARAAAGVTLPPKADCEPQRYIREFRLDEPADAKVGAVLTAAEVFNGVTAVDVTGTSKGRGTAGAMKRHGFHGLPASHGVKKHHRSPGSVGSHASNRGSGRPKKGKRMAGPSRRRPRHRSATSAWSASTPTTTCCWSRAPFPGPTAAWSWSGRPTRKIDDRLHQARISSALVPSRVASAVGRSGSPGQRVLPRDRRSLRLAPFVSRGGPLQFIASAMQHHSANRPHPSPWRAARANWSASTWARPFRPSPPWTTTARPITLPNRDGEMLTPSAVLLLTTAAPSSARRPSTWPWSSPTASPR